GKLHGALRSTSQPQISSALHSQRETWRARRQQFAFFRSGPAENCFDGLSKPSRGCFGGRRRRKVLDDNKALDFTGQKRVQERRVVTEGHASIRLAVGTEHV